MKIKILALAAAAFLAPLLASAQQQQPDYYAPPLDIPIYLSANFGEIRTNRFHTGIDIKTQGVVGKPLFAAADGHIARVTVAPGGYGRALYIAHPNGTTTVYAHMDRFTDELESYLRAERLRLKRSDIDLFPDAARFPVRRGDRIGTAGNSGASGGPHLHFEVRNSADSRALNVMPRGWIVTENPDDVPPRIVRLYHIDVDTLAGVPIHSRPRPYDVTKNDDGSWSLVRTSPLKGGPTSYFVVEATDRRGDVTNTFGIHRARLSIDGQERVVFEKDGVLFTHTRYACASVLYDVQRNSRNEAVMLALRSGNRLPMYKKAVERGVVSFGENGASKQIEITVEDDAGNISTLAFEVEPDLAHTPPPHPGGRIASNRGDFVHSADGLSVSIPRGALYEPIFYTQSVVEKTIAPRTDGIAPLSPILRTGDGVQPLQSAMKLGIEADIPENMRRRACLARVSDSGGLSWSGGTYSNGSVNGTSRDFGTFCVVVDTTSPTVKSSFAEGADLSGSRTVTITATDNFSGIANFTGSIDGEWIVFERNASRGQFVHRFDPERLAAGTTHTFEFTCRDGAGNSSTWRGTFYK
ncbi:MAG: M23 family metallopeptidase [Alistipes sp.]|jgi:hypothetical protein|nr:M23 family metallopeptidase [Alistipes sp.]